jgi:hypothetical protein
VRHACAHQCACTRTLFSHQPKDAQVADAHEEVELDDSAAARQARVRTQALKHGRQLGDSGDESKPGVQWAAGAVADRADSWRVSLLGSPSTQRSSSMMRACGSPAVGSSEAVQAAASVC